MMQGTARLILDTETGLLIALRTVEVIENQRGSYQSDVTYALKRMTYGAAPDASVFQLPSSDMTEVKELSKWNAAKIRKEMVGKPASELEATDIQGKSVSLSSYQGKLVLLDFWTTWCPPCRADAPALDKLYRKYGEKDLMIVGISVSEERAIVEKFLKEHPHSFPVVLTTENDMPRPYQIGVFPTYVVIDRDGTVASAVEGDQGFSDLRKLLKKAGLEIE
jgi:thiol-disulfide isomerase/thioredoxin